jgi:integrase
MRPRTRSLAGVHPKVASEALGHSSVSFTMDTYQHVLPTMGEQVAQAIERALGSTR